MHSGNAYGHARVKKGWMTGRKPNLDAYSKTNPATGSASIQHPLSEKEKKNSYRNPYLCSTYQLNRLKKTIIASLILPAPLRLMGGVATRLLLAC